MLYIYLNMCGKGVRSILWLKRSGVAAIKSKTPRLFLVRYFIFDFKPVCTSYAGYPLNGEKYEASGCSGQSSYDTRKSHGIVILSVQYHNIVCIIII